ncbi:MAG TPA: GNAT family protein [Verrucomicrobiae bacterium]|nr:GNAT family protein [Verrucomicrobiae bacterium]
MHVKGDERTVSDEQQAQMLKLVTRSFYKELVNYGVTNAQVLSVAAHLLDNVMQNDAGTCGSHASHNQVFRIGDVVDKWGVSRHLSVHEVSVRPVEASVCARVAEWLRPAAVRESFYPHFPQDETNLCRHLCDSGREYFAIEYQGELAGIVGAESIDPGPAKMEMRKLVGDAEMRGKGIGKRATFLFLYYAFMIRNFNKVYVYSMDTNIRNLHLNARFGFELEGVFREEAVVGGERRDVVRMGLCKQTWLKLFA